MPYYKKLSTCLILSIIATTSFATNSFPRGCEVAGYHFDANDLVLNESNQQAFYMIQSRSNRRIELEHFETRPDVFMSPKLEAKFDPLHWAAFASDIENMHFRCYTEDNGDKLQMNCRDVLDVCQYPRVKFALSNMGNYWVSTNKPQEQVIKDAVSKGILLRW
jgi:hypothetical protein